MLRYGQFGALIDQFRALIEQCARRPISEVNEPGGLIGGVAASIGVVKRGGCVPAPIVVDAAVIHQFRAAIDQCPGLIA